MSEQGASSYNRHFTERLLLNYSNFVSVSELFQNFVGISHEVEKCISLILY